MNANHATYTSNSSNKKFSFKGMAENQNSLQRVERSDLLDSMRPLSKQEQIAMYN